MNARHVVELLRAKHVKDFAVPECKDGPTWNRGHSRLDLWVSVSSWSPWRTIGYEVKIGRGDWLSDTKWTEYRSLCHEFYLVSPARVVAPEELPEGVGLYWASDRRLWQKRKAARREPDRDRLIQLMAYVLMHRVRTVDASCVGALADRPTEVRQLVESATQRGRLAEFVRGHVRQVYEESVRRLHEARALDQNTRAVLQRMNELGISLEHGVHAARRQVECLAGAVSTGLVNDLRASATRLERLATEIEGECARK